MNKTLKAIAATGLFVLSTAAVIPTIALAQDGEERTEQVEETQETLNEAANLVATMSNDEDLVEELKNAKGVFLVPNYGRAAVGVGVEGGEGVLLVREQGEWSPPMFYNMGSVSVGAQAGIEAGQIAMVLVTEDAVDAFLQDNNFSLNADAGITFIDWSARAQGTLGKGDIIIWSDTAGAFADLAINVEDIFWDEEENNAYYGEEVTPEAVAQGQVETEFENPFQN